MAEMIIPVQYGLRSRRWNAGEQGKEHTLSTAGKIPSICTINLKTQPDNSTRIFLFNGFPRGAFLAYKILWGSGNPLTGCNYDLVVERGNLKKWGIPVG